MKRKGMVGASATEYLIYLGVFVVVGLIALFAPSHADTPKRPAAAVSTPAPSEEPRK